MKNLIIAGSFLYVLTSQAQLTYPVVDTAQKRCYNASREISYPEKNRLSTVRTRSTRVISRNTKITAMALSVIW